jgi:hypothetical protein
MNDVLLEIERLQAAKRAALTIADARAKENVLLRAAMENIRDAKEPPNNPAPDDRDWRDMALEMKRVATIALEQRER